MRSKFFVLIMAWMGWTPILLAQEKIIQLYSGKPPGSENWTWQEARSDSNMFHTPVVYNVVQPTLTVFQADAAHANGTAIIIAPGGGFQALSINSEGNDEANWLAKKGVTAFVLKYRLARSFTHDPAKEFMNSMGDRKKRDSIHETIIPMAIADGLKAMDYVRKHAAEFHINPERIGFMGFSAGGTVTMGVVYGANAETRPNFIAPIYAFVPPNMEAKVPAEKTPAFIVAATDDQLGLAPHSVGIYTKWMDAKQSAELHMYAKGGHGFGSRKQNLPTDSWIDRFGEWLQMQGLLSSSK